MPIVVDEGDTAGENEVTAGPEDAGSPMEGVENATAAEAVDGSISKAADSGRNVTNSGSVSLEGPVVPIQSEKPVIPLQKSAESVQSEPREEKVISEKSVLPVSQSQVRNINLTFEKKKQGEGAASAASLMQSVAPNDAQVPHSLAQALYTALKEASVTRPMAQAWLDLVRDLFEAIYVKVRGPVSRLSEAAKRFPKLKAPEVERLLDYFEIAVVEGGKDWTEWHQQVVGAAVQAQRSTLSFEGILWKSIGQEKVKKANFLPAPLKGWVTKVAGRTAKESEDQLIKKTYLFKTTVFKPDEISRLRGVCEKDYGKFAPMMVRAGTDDEWRIVQGLVEGTIIAKQMPQFVKRIMKIDEQVRLVQTIRVQVEGCLVMDLSGESQIKEAYLSTKCLQESVATAAVTRGTGGVMLWKMVAQVKNISYDGVKHALYFHFFTRDMAAKFAGMKVPFHRYDHTLRNVHLEQSTSTRSAWEAQVDSNGERYEQNGFYSCVLKNITRSVDLLKLSGYLRKILGVDFHLDDLDKGGPYSDTSTLWELIVESDACPSALRGIKRIYWRHTMLVVEHPAMRGRRQCLRCGEAGHPMRKCTAPLEDLLKSHCLQVDLEDFKKFTPPATTFRSMEELRNQVEAVRLRQGEENTLAEEQDEISDERVMEEDKPSKKTPVQENKPHTAPTGASRASNASVNPNRTRSESSDWVTVKPKKKRREVSSQQTGEGAEQQAGTSAYTSSLKLDLAKTRSMENAQDQAELPRKEHLTVKTHTEKTATQLKVKDTLVENSIRSEVTRNKKKLRHKKKVEILQKKASTLLMLEDKMKTYLANTIAQMDVECGKIKVVKPKDETGVGTPDLTTIQDVIHWLSFQSIPTPATGNCQIFAVCQGLTSSDMISDNESLLEDMTKQLKQGCFVGRFWTST